MQRFTRPVRVAIVVERDFADHLPDLAKQTRVWIADTAPNRAAAERVWQSIEGGRNTGVTTFKVDTSLTPESWVVDILDVIDEHHGLRSASASDIELQVRGAAVTEAIIHALSSLGSFDVEEIADGFVARRRPAV